MINPAKPRTVFGLLLALGLVLGQTGSTGALHTDAQPSVTASRPPEPIASVATSAGPRIGAVEVQDAAVGGAPDSGEVRDIHALAVLRSPALLELVSADPHAGGREGSAVGTFESPAQRRLLVERIALRQEAALQAARALGLRVIDRYQVAANGILLRGDRDAVLALGDHPDVAFVSILPEARRAVGDAAEHVGATRARTELGFDGAGTVIAVMDSGIDYLHADFGGPGTLEAYAANDPDTARDAGFPSAKVIGGVDLAGSLYAADCPLAPPEDLRCVPFPAPDEDPLDEVYPDGIPGQGHGTHVAGVAAGIGAAQDPAAAHETGIDPGIAPGASLVAIKIFGTPRTSGGYTVGSTALTASGLEWVARHNLGLPVTGRPATGEAGERVPIDVLNVSLGSAYGQRSSVYERMVDQLVKAGVTVVASAGNSGDAAFVVGAPSTAPLALSVASSYAPGETAVAMRADWPAGSIEAPVVEAIEGLSRQIDTLDTPLSLPLAYYGGACDAPEGGPSEPSQDIAGKMALIARGSCLFVDKLRNAEALGAAGALVYSNDTQVIQMTGGCGRPGFTCFDLPAVMMGRSDGLRLRTQVLAGRAVTVTLSLDPLPDRVDRVGESSSRGPARFDGRIKPQITAPGMNLVSAFAGSGDRRRTLSGTSFAAPVVAGTTALLLERSRRQGLDLGPLELAALAMNRAEAIVHQGAPDTGPPVPIARQGSGRVDAYQSLLSQTLARSAEGIAELSYGDVHVDSDVLLETRVITLTNLGDEARRFRPTPRLLFGDDEAKGVSLRFEPETLRLEPGASEPLEAVLSVDPNGLRRWTLGGAGRDRSLASVSDLARFEVDGFVEIEELDDAGAPLPPGAGERASLPFLVLPQRHACVETDATALLLGPESEAEQVLTNLCVEPGGLGVYRQLGDTYPSPNKPAKLDIERVGIRHYLLPSSVRDSALPDLRLQMVEVLLQTRGLRRTPLDTQPRVFFDTDLDGEIDRVGVVETFPGPEFATFVAPVYPGTLEPDLRGFPRNPETGNIRLFVAYMPYDIDEETIVLRFFANHPVYGIDAGIDLRSGDVAFDMGVDLEDVAADFERNEAFDGFDRIPEDPDEAGLLRFDQARLDCLELACPGCAAAIDGSTAELVDLDANGGELRLELEACELDPSGPVIETALLFHVPRNGPGRRVLSRPLRIQHEMPSPRIFLPIGLSRAGLIPPSPSP